MRGEETVRFTLEVDAPRSAFVDNPLGGGRYAAVWGVKDVLRALETGTPGVRVRLLEAEEVEVHVAS